MIDHVPHCDDVEEICWQIDIVKSTRDDVCETKRLASILSGRWRNLTPIRLPSRIRRHGLQKESESTAHVEEASRTPDEKSLEEILVHSGAGRFPIEVVAVL